MFFFELPLQYFCYFFLLHLLYIKTLQKSILIKIFLVNYRLQQQRKNAPKMGAPQGC